MKLYETLFILRKCNMSMETTWTVYSQNFDLLEKYPEFENSLVDYIILEYVNFIDEFNSSPGNIEPIYQDRMKTVRKISKPILKRVDKWDSLEKYRNNFVGHTFRDRGKFVIPDPTVYKTPRTRFEVCQLVLYVRYIYQILESEFSSEITASTRYLLGKIPPPLPKADYSEINKDLEAMANEVNQICIVEGRRFPLQVMGFIFPDKKK